MPGLDEVLAELRAEDDALIEVLSQVSTEQWDAPSPAQGWTIRDQVSHLADTNDICIDTIKGGPRSLNEAAKAFSSPEEFTESGCIKGRAMSTAEVLEWFRSSARAQQEALAACEPKQRIPWGLGMSGTMMVTARLMEHWAHGTDIRRGLGLEPLVTPRLRSIAFLTLKAVPYALAYAQVAQPAGTLRAELTYDGETWNLGPDDADNVITGDALEFCTLGIRRMTRSETQTLKAHGPLAEAAIDNLRAFL
jgi:uncharacterized protein (TIGR03084 family)